MSDDNPLAGKGDQAAGKAKEAVGNLTGDEDLEAEGKGQHAGGKVHEAAHDVKEKGKDLIDKVKGD
mgnify:CR=1 FL=1